jgi:ATP-binding cassette subfamily B protein
MSSAETPDQPIISNVLPLSDAVSARLEAEGVRRDDICLWIESDLDFSGQACPIWLAVTQDCLFVVPLQAGAGLTRYRIADVQKFQTRSVVGSGFLQAQTDGLMVDVVRYSNTRREMFGRFVEQLERLRTEKTCSVERVYEQSPRLCSACGLPLPGRRAPCPRCIKQSALFVRTFKLLQGYLFWVIILFSLMLVGIVLDMLPPYLIRVMVDDVLKLGTGTSGDMSSREALLLAVVGGLVGAALCRNGLNVLIGRLTTKVGVEITIDVRKRVFEKIQQFSVDYYDRHPVGNLMQRVSGDSEAFHGFISQVASGFVLNILRLVAIGFMLFYMDWRLASFVLIPVPFVILGTAIYWQRIYPRYYKLSDASAKVASLISGIFSGIRVVKAFAQEDKEENRFVRGIEYLRDVRLWVGNSASTFSPLMSFIFSMGGFIVWYAGGRFVLKDQGVTLGTLMAFLGYLGMFYGPLQGLTELSNWLTSFLASAQRVFDILDTPLAQEDSPDAKPLGEVRGAIEFEKVTFGYDPYNPVLKDVSLRIEPGQMIGIVGKSGSGKTTIVNLLCRFYDVQKGAVKIDGKDIRDLRRSDLRKHIGLVLQEPFLFRATIAHNIAYGRPEATPHQILDAAKAANAHNFIMRQPLAYDTQLGESGAGLSGGERQRTSLARAILYDPSILVLDEATSSVDTESEQEIQRALAVVCKGRTTIAIAHRLSTLRGADHIYVIDDGRVAESGSHDELMAKEGIYYRLVKIQTELTRLEQGKE